MQYSASWWKCVVKKIKNKAIAGWWGKWTSHGAGTPLPESPHRCWALKSIHPLDHSGSGWTMSQTNSGPWNGQMHIKYLPNPIHVYMTYAKLPEETRTFGLCCFGQSLIHYWAAHRDGSWYSLFIIVAACKYPCERKRYDYLLCNNFYYM